MRRIRTLLGLVRKGLQTKPADWIEELKREFQDDITRGTFSGLMKLEHEQLDPVMECQAQACMESFVKLYDLPAHLDLDTFLKRIRTGGPSKIEIEREGDTILWRELHEGHCMCPLVSREVVPLSKGLCQCSIHWVRKLIERHAGRHARVELAESVAGGGQNCVFRIQLGEKMR